MSNKPGRKVNESEGILADLRNSIASKPTTRRDFLKMAGVGGAGLIAFGVAGCSGKVDLAQNLTPERTTYVPNAKMVLVHQAARCVGCRRCEVACNLAHDGKVQPAISRIKVQRNRNFGPEGPRVGAWRGEGVYGNFRVIADTCLQCPHPVPCMNSCPVGAIEIDPNTNARVINATKCIGCQTCVKACPWAMTSFDADAKKSTKCDLCGGDPQCVKWCPTGAITVTAWRDRTKDTPVRQVVPAYITAADGVAETCATCHPTTVTTAK